MSEQKLRIKRIKNPVKEILGREDGAALVILALLVLPFTILISFMSVEYLNNVDTDRHLANEYTQSLAGLLATDVYQCASGSTGLYGACETQVDASKVLPLLASFDPSTGKPEQLDDVIAAIACQEGTQATSNTPYVASCPGAGAPPGAQFSIIFPHVKDWRINHIAEYQLTTEDRDLLPSGVSQGGPVPSLQEICATITWTFDNMPPILGVVPPAFTVTSTACSMATPFVYPGSFGGYPQEPGGIIPIPGK